MLCTGKDHAFPYFNSMIVRLKVHPPKSVNATKKNFNSMIVRLKAPYGEIPVFRTTLFQFYDSPIKRFKTSNKHKEVLLRFQFYDSPIKRKRQFKVRCW